MDVTTLIAVCALGVAVFSTALATWTAYEQRKHMRLSVRPIATIAVADFQNKVGVFLQNKGLGPLRIVTLRATDNRGTTRPSLISFMPSLSSGIPWSNFYDNVDEATLEPGKRLDLLLLEGDPNDHAFATSRDLVRQSLARLVIVVEYEDIYGQRMKSHTQELAWFERLNTENEN